MKKVLLFMICLLASPCALAVDNATSAKYAYQALLEEQCEENLGFATGTKQHMQCRIFYENIFKYQAEYLTSYAQVDFIRKQIQNMDEECQDYWGDEDISKETLWECVQQKGSAMIIDNQRQKDLDDESDMLRRALHNDVRHPRPYRHRGF